MMVRKIDFQCQSTTIQRRCFDGIYWFGLSQTIYLCYKDKQNGMKEQVRLRNTPEAFDYFLRSDDQTSAVFESSRGWPVLVEMIRDSVDHMKMAHPLKVKAIASARIKTDKIDSNILAELLKADLIPEAHLRHEENRSNLKVLRQRAFPKRRDTHHGT